MPSAKHTPYVEQRFDGLRGLDGISDEQIGEHLSLYAGYVRQVHAMNTELAGLRRAKAYGSVSAFRSISRWRLGGELLASGSRPDVAIASFTGERVQVPGYAVLNLLARFNYNKNLFMAARLENALVKEYQLVHGFNTAPRGMFITAGWQP